MSLADAIEAIPRKTMVLFFLIDTSGSMAGSKIGAVNTAIEEVIPELQGLSAANADAQVKIAALEFSAGFKWLTPDPVDIDQFHWNYLDAVGQTDMGHAFKGLNEKLSTKYFMKEATGSYAPALFLLSDGAPTDDYQSSLEELRKNNWYKNAIKVAVAIGDDANKDVLAEFTGSKESVLEVHNAAMLKKMVRFVSVRASQVASQSSTLSALKGNAIQSNTTQAAPVPPQAPVQLSTKQQSLNQQIATLNTSIDDEGDDEW
jgi:uncharacterized protein YegL